jgi:hypothetical protein
MVGEKDKVREIASRRKYDKFIFADKVLYDEK